MKTDAVRVAIRRAIAVLAISGFCQALAADALSQARIVEKVAGKQNLGWNYPLMMTFNTGINLNF